MLLSALEVRNFRSLEHVALDGLSQLNVLIGRNNAGKSAILDALQFLAATVFGVVGSHDFRRDPSVLTAHDPARVLRYRLTFRTLPEERRRFVAMMIAAGYRENRAEALLASPFLRQASFEFVAPPGEPARLQLTEAFVRTEDNKLARMLSARGEWNGPSTTYATPQVFHDEHIRRLGQLTEEALGDAAKGGQGLQIDWTTGAVLHGTVPAGGLWLVPQLVDYFANAYFFSPFRHSAERRFASPQGRLAPDGANLPVVLNYLSGRARPTFERVEAFLRAAVPNVGTLHPGLVEGEPQHNAQPQEVEITFQVADGYDVRLRDTGGGVEQLLMTATVLATTAEGATLFLEEPETHLHAGAQRYLIERLRTGSRQVFVATHSPTFVNLTGERSLFRVRAAGGGTTVERVVEADDLAGLMADIGARNSDLLLSDAVLFVEGPSDRAVVLWWARTLGLGLEERNVTVLPMGGGRSAERQAPARSDVLIGMSMKAPVPHLFVLDRDERGQAETDNLDHQLGARLHLLDRRELENYLLAPRAILAALQAKYRDDDPVLERVRSAHAEDVDQLIHTATEGLYSHVLLKRIKAEIGGLRDGLLLGDVVSDLAPRAKDPDLATAIEAAIRSRADSVIDGLNLSSLVQAERQQLDGEWAQPEHRLGLAPGAEILEHVFRHFGGRFEKRTDAPRIAAEMTADEIAPEIRSVIGRGAELSGSPTTYDQAGLV